MKVQKLLYLNRIVLGQMKNYYLQIQRTSDQKNETISDYGKLDRTPLFSNVYKASEISFTNTFASAKKLLKTLIKTDLFIA